MLPSDSNNQSRKTSYLVLKFIYSEKATKFCEISTLLLSVCTVDKSKVEISQNFVAFSEYTKFKDSGIYVTIDLVTILKTLV